MNFLRRGRSETEPADAAPGSPGSNGQDRDAESVAVADRGRTPGKGRPTPSRRQAEGKRRGPVAPAPKTQREAFRRSKTARGSKEERRAQSDDRRARMMAGDDRVLPARDRGPVKAYIRDQVDSRGHLMGLFMPLAVLIFITVVLPYRELQSLGSILCLVVLAAMALEGVLLGRMILGRVRERFPNEQVKPFGVGWYAFTRATQIRKLRMPKPRVARGGTVP